MTRALLLDPDLTLRLGEREPVEPAAGDVVVDVAWAGVCGSDLHVLASGDWVEYWPATLGHEVVGAVVESRADVPVGTRVLVDSRIPCGDCDGCSRTARLCTAMAWVGERLPGGYADRLTIPATSVHEVPADLDLGVAVLAEPLAVTISAVDRVRVDRADGAPRSVLLLGYGPIGAFVHAEVARRWPQTPVTVVEPAATRSALAATQGATVTTEPDGAFDLVVDAAGYPGSLTDAVPRTSSGGTLLLVALAKEPVDVVPADLVERSITLQGSVGFDTEHLPRALRALAADPARYAAIVTDRVPLAELPQFLADQRHRRAGKVLVECGS